VSETHATDDRLARLFGMPFGNQSVGYRPAAVFDDGQG
jgi:hypothetical protein